MCVSRRIADSYEVVAGFEYVTCRLLVERGEIGEFEFKRELALFTGGEFFRLAVCGEILVRLFEFAVGAGNIALNDLASCDLARVLDFGFYGDGIAREFYALRFDREFRV